MKVQNCKDCQYKCQKSWFGAKRTNFYAHCNKFKKPCRDVGTAECNGQHNNKEENT